MATVLVVDDDADFRFLLREALSARGYAVVDVDKNRESIMIGLQHRPHLVLVDILMDQARQGFQAIQEIKSNPQTASLPVLAMTVLAQFEIEHYREELAPLVDGLVFKPFDLEELFGAVALALAGRWSPGATGCIPAAD